MSEQPYLKPQEVDGLLRLPCGRSARLARKGLIPAIILPDGTIRFSPDIIQKLQRAALPSAEARA